MQPKQLILDSYRDYIGINLNSFYKKIPKEKSFLFIGATGFFGKNLLNMIYHSDINNSKKNKYYIVSDRIKKKKFSSLHFLNRKTFFANFTKKIDYIFYFGANFNVNQRDNLKNEIKILEKIKKLNPKKIIFTSSGAVYKKKNSRYKKLKLKIENFISKNFKKKNVLILRCFTFVGPFLENSGNFAITQIARSLISKEKLIINNSNTVRSFLAIDKFILFIFKIFNNKNGILDVGSTKKLKLIELVYQIKSKIKSNTKIIQKTNSNDIYLPKRNIKFLNSKLNKYELKDITLYINYLKNEKN